MDLKIVLVILAFLVVSDSDEDFHLSDISEYRERFQNALTGLNMLRHFETSTIPKRRKIQPKRRGPPPKKLKLKTYFLPEGSNLPKLSRMDPNIAIHQQHGFGYPASVYNPKTFKGAPVQFELNQSEEEFKEKIRELYPGKLEGKDFYMYTLDNSRRFISVPRIPRELKNLKYQGTIIIMMNGNQGITQEAKGKSMQDTSKGENFPSATNTYAIPQPPEFRTEPVSLEQQALDEDYYDTLPQIQLPRRRSMSETESVENIQERRNIVARQDAEFQECLEKDREKDQQIKEQEKKEIELQRLRDERRSKIPTEPGEGISLKIRTPQCTVTRKFLETTPTEILMNFVGSMSSSSEYFKVAIPGMEKPLYSHFHYGCLRDVGIVSSSVLQVTWLSEDEAPLEKFEEVSSSKENDQQPSSSSAIPRPQRQAAALCNVKMKDWLIPNSSIQQTSVLTVESSDDDSLPDIPDTYRNYVDVVCISSDSSSESEDSSSKSEIDKTYPELTAEPEEADPFLTLTILSSKIQKSAVTRFNVNRQNVWDCTIRKLKKEDFVPFNDLLIRFSDCFGEMEEGIDQGGPKREFLDLLMDQTLNSSLFEGSSKSKFLSWNKKAFDNDDYYYAGIVIGLSLVHGGPAPGCFDPSFVKALLQGPASVKVTIEDMPNEELRSKLEKILGAKTQNSREKAIEKLSSILSLAGIDAVCQKTEEVEAMICRVVHWYLFDRSAQAYKRFCDGLDTLDIMKNLQSLHKLFIYKKVKFSMDSFEHLFEYQLSENGSNQRNAQNVVLGWWRDYLEEVEGGDTPLTFSKILHFGTGSKEPPPLGFDPKPSICFWQEKLPKAITCTNTLYLPTANSTYKDFKNSMEFAVLNTEGFLLY